MCSSDLLIATDAPEDLAKQIIALGMSVREAEGLARAKMGRAAKARPTKDADTRALEASLSIILGLAVEIDDRGPKGGEVRITYRSLEQLEDVCRRLRGSTS